MKKIKRDTSIARNVWKSFFGEIPKDDSGRSYEIHHMDGNCENNDIQNLSCVSIEEHYNIHLNRGEVASANLIADRMKMSDLPKQSSRWVFKGEKEILISTEKLNEYIAKGWNLGMISTRGENNPMHKNNGIKPPTLNKIWINDGKTDILIDKDIESAYIQENSNWKRGRLRISGDKNPKSFLGRHGILHPRSKKICKICIETHQILEVYDGIREAVRKMNKQYAGNLPSACKSYDKFEKNEIKRPKICFGYYWKYE
jgi:hypothetical protein